MSRSVVAGASPVRLAVGRHALTPFIGSVHSRRAALESAGMTAVWPALAVALVILSSATDWASPADFEALAGQPVDIAPSSYLYRADRKPDANAPESWVAVMRYARQPLNQPADLNAPAVKSVLCALLWEEIRPIQRIELTWASKEQPRPSPADISLTTLDNQGTASSWWNNLAPVTKGVEATVSTDALTYAYELPTESCGLVLSVGSGRTAADYTVPSVRVLVAEKWKKVDFELEWGYEPATAAKDYSGRIDVYDGRVAGLAPLDGDATTRLASSDSWSSAGKNRARRGLKATLLYMGTSKWRRVQPFTSQPDDVARTIVTVRTRSGNFSFLAGDLENGPLLAPEYGFFVRRTSEAALQHESQPDLRTPRILFTEKMHSIAGNSTLLGWGSDNTPWFGGNPTDHAVTAQNIVLPSRTLAMHPGPDRDVAVGWRSPVKALVRIQAGVTHAQTCGNGIEWWLARETKTERKTLAHGVTEGTGSQKIPTESRSKELGEVVVEPADMISLVVGPKGAHQCDTMLIDFAITEVGGQARTWTLKRDVLETLHEGNPHADGQGRPDVWYFYCEKPAPPPLIPSEPPLALASKASNAREFTQELEHRKLETVRQRIRAHPEQTWEGAVTAMRGTNLPPHQSPPPGFAPPMQVEVPSARLTAQWNLGVWHLLRHAQKHPQAGRLWFNDHPYGILAAETYMILAALDLMGSHQAAEDGFEQWLSLPMDSKTSDQPGHNAGALPDRPTGLFSDGHGCLTHAVGPPGAGGHMDGIHAFGPGSIGWALVEHYRLTGDTNWFRAHAARMKANVEWMLRQRRVLEDSIPGGERLWCKGLEPALQVTPDSGGLWMQFYEAEAYYWAAAAHFADALATVDPPEGARLKTETDAWRRDLLTAVERSIALSPVVPVRDGTFHSVIPFACYVRGLATGAWGWRRDGSGSHVGPLYWETVQSAAALVSPAWLLSPNDVRVQGYLDVLEDRLLLENPNVGGRDWFAAGWQYQAGLERTANMHLAGDDIPVFLRSLLNGYAVDILPQVGYVFNEHAVHGPPDKIFEEAAFLERIRNLLVMEQGDTLWLARATPRAWLEQDKKITVKNAPTHFGVLAYQIISDVDDGKITATVEIPARTPPKSVLLRFRHPRSARLKRVTVNGKNWSGFDTEQEIIRLKGFQGTLAVVGQY